MARTSDGTLRGEAKDISFGPFAGRIAFAINEAGISLDKAGSSGSVQHLLFPSSDKPDPDRYQFNAIKGGTYYGDYDVGPENAWTLKRILLAELVKRLARSIDKGEDSVLRLHPKVVALITAPSCIEIGSAEETSVKLKGFAERELVGGHWGRWTVGATAVIDLARGVPAQADLDILIPSMYGNNAGSALAVGIGGDEQPVPLASAGWHRASFANRFAADAITFKVPFPQSPKDRGESADPRKLGVFVSSIRIARRG